MTKQSLRFTSKALALVSATALVATLAACSSSTPSSSPSEMTSSSDMNSSATSQDMRIKISYLAFMPPSITVKAGTTVTWENDEDITHTVTSGNYTGVDATTGLRSGQKSNGLFNAALKGKGDTFSYTFTKPGIYHYYCDIHYGMNATVTVTA